MAKKEVLNKVRVRKMARFIGKLKPYKLEMSVVCELYQSEKMDAYHCKSAACVMGWMPAVFPKYARWTKPEPGLDSPNVQIRLTQRGHWQDLDVEEFFGMPEKACDIMFGSGFEGYNTPAQVSKGLINYINSNGTEFPRGAWVAY